MALFRFSSALDPMSNLIALQQELDRFFENPRGVDLGLSGRGVFPPVNIFSDKEGYVVRLEIPGVAPDQLRIDTEGRTLTISGKREDGNVGDASFHRRERDIGEFSRSLQLPESLDLSRADAAYKHGVLTVRVPKKEEAKPRQITVKAA
jgi:HSP20 family protein